MRIEQLPPRPATDSALANHQPPVETDASSYQPNQTNTSKSSCTSAALSSHGGHQNAPTDTHTFLNDKAKPSPTSSQSSQALSPETRSSNRNGTSDGICVRNEVDDNHNDMHNTQGTNDQVQVDTARNRAPATAVLAAILETYHPVKNHAPDFFPLYDPCLSYDIASSSDGGDSPDNIAHDLFKDNGK